MGVYGSSHKFKPCGHIIWSDLGYPIVESSKMDKEMKIPLYFAMIWKYSVLLGKKGIGYTLHIRYFCLSHVTPQSRTQKATSPVDLSVPWLAYPNEAQGSRSKILQLLGIVSNDYCELEPKAVKNTTRSWHRTFLSCLPYNFIGFPLVDAGFHGWE